MKTENLIGRIMHFLVHNGFSFTVSVMCLVHATLLFLMWLYGVTPLVQFNVLSVVVYVFCFLLCKSGHYMPVFASIIIEVTVYTIFSTNCIGLRCGTYCFLFSIVPIIIYFGRFLFKGKGRWFVVLMLVLNFAIFVYLYMHYTNIPPAIEVSAPGRLTLVIFSSFVMVFSTVFYNAIYIYSSEMEVTDLEKKNKQLSADAQEDVLTSLLNRRGFLPVIKRLMTDPGASHFCISFCDIDNFKRINDSHGHDAGDEVLRHITRMIKREMNGCDICRWGGEEIVILMRDYDMAVAKEKMEYLRRSVELSPTVFFNHRIFATITIGIEEYRASYIEPEEIIKVADDRMYYGKQHGKNVVVFEDHKTEEEGPSDER
ncbi:MAG: GGDEF domain-containing protein [Lachnospiraceae bacterium]|nr:GGDEF domain-containing protein [Lachnospiraceae bacterium]